jgi:hypothetical protein
VRNVLWAVGVIWIGLLAAMNSARAGEAEAGRTTYLVME